MRPLPIAVVGLPEQAIQALVMEVVEPPLTQVTRGLHTSESAVNEPADESCDFWPCAMPAKRQYCRSRNTPECAMTVARKRDWRSVNPRGSKQMARSATTSRKPRRLTGSPLDLLG
jgi:hypothetical protein